MPRGKTKRADIRDIQPTTIIFDARMTIDGGTLASPEINKIWGATHRAFQKAAHECGIGYAWLGEVGCVDPLRMRKRVERLSLHVSLPPNGTQASDAVGLSDEDSTDRQRA